MKYLSLTVVILLFMPALAAAQYSGPPTEGGCNSCETEAAGPDAPHLQPSVPSYIQQQDANPVVSEEQNRLLVVLISLMQQLQELIVRLKLTQNQVPEPTPTPIPTPAPSPFPPHPDELGATCSNYTYDSCPAFCSQKCVVINQCANPDSDTCGEPNCNGQGSCYYDPSPRTSEPDNCSDYTYGSCPSTCVKQCVSSSCRTTSSGETICTDDCDGTNSCVSPNP